MKKTIIAFGCNIGNCPETFYKAIEEIKKEIKSLETLAKTLEKTYTSYFEELSNEDKKKQSG